MFSREKLTASTKAITDRLGNDGYAFANANAVPHIDKEKRTVAFSIVVDPGRRVYVRRIDVAGNTKTRDEVVRREMRQLEGAYYDASKIQLSRRRIDRTQFFSEVTVETRPVEGSPDQVDVVYTVKERPTGALLLGVGFSSVEKIALSASIRQSNVFGTGKYLSANVNSGSVNQVYSLSYLDPYYTVDGVSRGFDVYKRETDASNLAVGPYVTDSIGGGVKFGYPVSEQVSRRFRRSTWSRSSSRSSPTARCRTSTSSTSSATSTPTARSPRAGARYARQPDQTTRGTLRARFQRARRRRPAVLPPELPAPVVPPAHAHLHAALGGEIGYADGYGGKPLPFFKNFFAGGPGSVRGYRSFSLGPRDVFGNAIGGNRKFVGSAEVLFPMPGAEQDQSLRLAAFVDGGQVYAEQKIDLGELRYAAGIGLDLVLAVRSAAPVLRASAEREQRGPEAEATIHLRNRLLR